VVEDFQLMVEMENGRPLLQRDWPSSMAAPVAVVVLVEAAGGRLQVEAEGDTKEVLAELPELEVKAEGVPAMAVFHLTPVQIQVLQSETHSAQAQSRLLLSGLHSLLLPHERRLRIAQQLSTTLYLVRQLLDLQQAIFH
jgi:hypothetical protein